MLLPLSEMMFSLNFRDWSVGKRDDIEKYPFKIMENYIFDTAGGKKVFEDKEIICFGNRLISENTAFNMTCGILDRTRYDFHINCIVLKYYSYQFTMEKTMMENLSFLSNSCRKISYLYGFNITGKADYSILFA